jgi:hypothetical protein
MNSRIASGRVLTGLVALLFSQAAFATPPAAPVVTVGAGLKQLQFDWNYVPRAGHYEVWFRSNPGAAWAKFADTPSWRPRANVNISAHLLHWAEARYVIKACNPSGCTSSSEISVPHLMKDSVGYFKASTPYSAGPHNLGRDAAMSEDGSTIAAGGGYGGGLGVEGTVVVFRKHSAGWVEEAQLLPSVIDQNRGGSSVSPLDINGDGSVIVLGAPEEVRPDTDAGEFPAIGAVYLFRRTSTGWVQEQRFASSNSEPDDAFGRFVDLDESGTLLAVSRRWGDGNGPSNANAAQGPVELYRHTSSGWVPLATIPVVGDRCYAMRVSGDGSTLVRSCGAHVEVFTAPDWQRVARLPNPFDGLNLGAGEHSVAVSYDGSRFAARSIEMEDDGSTFNLAVAIYRQVGSGWAREATLPPGEWTTRGDADYPAAAYGLPLSMSRDGRLLAAGSVRDPATGTGVLYPPIINGNTNTTGAVYVYERRPTGWRLRQFIKPNSDAVQFPGFGWAVSLSRNGKDLAVGAPGDASNARGIDGDQADTSAPDRGAVWLY